MSSFVCLVSCNEQESDLLSANQSSNNQLSIVTHTREGETPIASVYLFNASNAFVRTLQTDAAGDYNSASASVKLPAGNYTICAINSSGLSHFQLPDEATATPTSVIGIAEGQTMGDLLMDMKNVTLTNGDNAPVDMELQRKVLELSSVTISQVPEDVTGVTVSVGSFSSAIQFNGTYVETAPITCTFSLTHNTTTSNWESAPQQLVFPSIGRPSITITFNRGEEDTHSYTYVASAALSANNKYDITGTYTEVSFSGTITSQDWPDDPIAIDFEFDESNTGNNSGGGEGDSNEGSGDETSEAPVVGQLYNGYYVVSVDAANCEAVLLSNRYTKDVTQSNYQTYLSNIPKPQNAISNWRIPTELECKTFLSGPATPGIFSDNKENYFCYAEEALTRCYAVKSSDGTVTFTLSSASFNNLIYLRPVIDISYE
jgi:hypothetical protein